VFRIAGNGSAFRTIKLAGFLVSMPAADLSPQDSLPNLQPPGADRVAAAAFRNPIYRPLRSRIPEEGIEGTDGNGRYQWHGSEGYQGSIPGLDKALTKKYLLQYGNSGGLAWLQTVMARSEPYIAFIRKEIDARGLPHELAFLPVIESSYLSTAVSRSGAVGLWQFMKNSISPFGIRVDDWVDERKDFWKATDGALRKLEENYRYFKDWPLALAAYNAGLGAVQRAVQAGGARDYWMLSERKLLKTETIQYVPKFLAVSAILSQAGRYGIDLGWPEDPAWTRIAAERTVDLNLLAEKASADAKRLKAANQELHFGVTPPGKVHHIKVPAAEAEAVAAVLARKDINLIQYYFHTVRSGDTLSALARHYGVTVDHIVQSNPGIEPRYLKLGARIRVPAFKEIGPYAREANVDASLVFSGTHLVKKGESLWSIALAYDVDPEQLAQANGMELTSTLREGRALKTPIRIMGDPR